MNNFIGTLLLQHPYQHIRILLLQVCKVIGIVLIFVIPGQDTEDFESPVTRLL